MSLHSVVTAFNIRNFKNHLDIDEVPELIDKHLNCLGDFVFLYGFRLFFRNASKRSCLLMSLELLFLLCSMLSSIYWLPLFLF